MLYFFTPDMKRLLLLLFLLPMVALGKVPVEDDITTKILNPESEFYYPNLYMRFKSGDLTLSEEDYHYLYYGFAYHEDYRPLESNDAFDKLLLLASYIDPEKPEIATLEQIIIAIEEASVRDPFSPQILNLKAFAYGALGNTTQEQIAYEQMRHIMRTIESSGDGLSQKTPCHIIMFDHALSLMASYGLEHQRAKIISRSVEYIPLLEPRIIMQKKIKGYYFDYSRIYRNKPEGYVFKRERTWQFNNLPPRQYK